MAAKKSKIKIVGGMKISEIIAAFPETIPIFFDFGFHCVGCPSAAHESLIEGAESHGIVGKNFDSFLTALNSAAAKKNPAKKGIN